MTNPFRDERYDVFSSFDDSIAAPEYPADVRAYCASQWGIDEKDRQPWHARGVLVEVGMRDLSNVLYMQPAAKPGEPVLVLRALGRYIAEHGRSSLAVLCEGRVAAVAAVILRPPYYTPEAP